jgi:hypothetical protein
MVRHVLTVALETDEYRALVSIAERERRRPADQAAVLLRQRLARARRAVDATPEPSPDERRLSEAAS